jgi:ATP-dependent DNA ligase
LLRHARRGHDWTDGLSKLVPPAASLKTQAAILDGEVQDEHGRTDFNEPERELGKKSGSNKLVFYVFNLLYLDGLDLRGATLIQRKDVLRELLSSLDPEERIKFSDHLEGDGAQLREQACEIGLEGIVSKRKDGRYASGRTDLWVKAPCKRRDTFVRTRIQLSRALLRHFVQVSKVSLRLLGVGGGRSGILPIPVQLPDHYGRCPELLARQRCRSPPRSV